MNAYKRAGFTLVELIIVAVLGSLIVMASLQVLITNQRTYSAQNAKIQGQQTTRAAMDVLLSELREISPQDGDLLAMGPDSVTIRTMRKFGVTCATDYTGDPVLTVIRVGDFFQVGDSAFVFADNNPAISADDVWISAEVTGVDSTSVTCASQEAQELTFAGQINDFNGTNVVSVGAGVRSYERYTYGLYTIDGETYLGRRRGGSAVPLVGPVRPSDGIDFDFLDEDGAVTTTATAVRQIIVTIRTTSNVLGSGNDPVADSITARVFTRN